MAQAVYSLESLKMGAAGANGAMGTNLTNISKIAAGTVAFDWASPSQNSFTAEEDNAPWVTLSEAQAKKISFESQDMSTEAMMAAFGGTIATGKLTPGINFEIPPQSLEIVTRQLHGKKVKFCFPLVQAFASLTGSLQKTDLLRIKFDIVVLQPTSNTGTKLPDFTFEVL